MMFKKKLCPYCHSELKKKKRFNLFHSRSKKIMEIAPEYAHPAFEGYWCWYCGTKLPDDDERIDSHMLIAAGGPGPSLIGNTGTIEIAYDGPCENCRGYLDYRQWEYPEDGLRTIVDVDFDLMHFFCDVVDNYYSPNPILTEEEMERFSIASHIGDIAYIKSIKKRFDEHV